MEKPVQGGAKRGAPAEAGGHGADAPLPTLHAIPFDSSLLGRRKDLTLAERCHVAGEPAQRPAEQLSRPCTVAADKGRQQTHSDEIVHTASMNVGDRRSEFWPSTIVPRFIR